MVTQGRHVQSYFTHFLTHRAGEILLVPLFRVLYLLLDYRRLVSSARGGRAFDLKTRNQIPVRPANPCYKKKRSFFLMAARNTLFPVYSHHWATTFSRSCPPKSPQA